jgi:hypothetical protein
MATSCAHALASDTISRTAIGRLRAKELPVDAEALMYERSCESLLRYCRCWRKIAVFRTGTSLFALKGDLSFPKIPPGGIADIKRVIQAA